MYALRALAVGGGAGLAAFALIATAVGPVASLWLAVPAWLAVAGAGAAGTWWALREAREIRGPGAARLLSAVRPELASATRSAVELDGDARARELAPDLVAAHAARVQASLAQVPVQVVVPWTRLRHPAVAGGAAAAILAVAMLGLSDRSASGAYALLHPSQEDADGLRVAAVVSQMDARLVYPDYLERSPVALTDVSRLEAPLGTTVEVAVEPRIAATAGVLAVGDARVRLTPQPDGWLRGSFVVREDAEMRIRLEDGDGTWLRDPVSRHVRALADQVPSVALIEPAVDRVVELREEISVSFEAHDDVALESVDLVVRTTDGREVRRRLADYPEHREAQASGTTSIVAASFSARPGDDLVVWLEARDTDQVSGPNVGKSAERRLTVASEATRRAEELADLRAVLNAGLDALADRLENGVPPEAGAAQQRWERVQPSTDAFAVKLDDLAMQLRDRPASEHDVYEEMSVRVERLLTREARLHRGRIASASSRRQADDALVQELENDSLLLADLLGRAQIEDAAAIARELDDLRRQMTSLLEELRRADSPEARQALMAAINRAQARMRELMERMASMAREVPQDFINTDAIPQREASDALESLREAVERGDLDAAERQLAELERQIDTIAQALGGGMDQFTQARFGPRERALAEALDQLAGLEAEQQQLARRSSDVRREAAERALAETGAANDEAARRLSREAGQIRQALEQMAQGGAPMDSEAFERAQQRMRDVEDALSTGDLGEARRMAQEASGDVEDLARDLDLSALMFPGVEGDTAEAAREARQAADDLRGLRRDIDQAIPRVGDFVGEGHGRQMREDAERQGEVGDAAKRLAERFRESPDGTPLSPEAADAIEQARETMQQAEQSLERRDPIDASRAQEEAARRLTELREQLERQQQQQSQGGGGGNQGGEGALDFREPVRIPGAEEFSGPMERRRRLLDAMREGAPDGYEESVRRYYEELLR